MLVRIVPRNFGAHTVSIAIQTTRTDTANYTTTGTATAAAGTHSALPRVLQALKRGALRDECRAQRFEARRVDGECSVRGLELLAIGDGGGERRQIRRGGG